jgi:formate dehydrogenase major subunit
VQSDPISKEDVSFWIDGQEVKAAVDSQLLKAVLAVAEIPHICYHSELMGPIRSCDTCLVEVDGKLVRSCAEHVTGGSHVGVLSERAKAARTAAYDTILGNHMLYCTVCDNNNENCRVHNTAVQLQINHQQHPYKPKPYPVDMSNPFYRYDPSQCILCGQCVQACQTVEVNETLTIDWDREHPRVLWDGGEQIAGSSCVSCGHCVTVCPCNALMEKSMLGEAGYLSGMPHQALDKMINVIKSAEPEMGYAAIIQVSQIEATMREDRTKRTKTVCTFCGVGCSYDVWTKDRHILKIVPLHGDVNQISTCVKGKFGWEFVNSRDRLQKPLIREGNKFRETTWDEALAYIGGRLKKIKQESGPDAVGVIISSKTSNEDSYLMQKFARAVIGTNNIDNCSRYCQAPATEGLFRTVGYAGDWGSIEDIHHSSLVVIVGANTAEAHPVIATRIKRAHKFHGQRLIVADIRRHEMAERADIFFRPRPGTDLVWLSAAAKYVFDHGLEKKEFLAKWVNGIDEYRKSLETFTMEYASRVCELPIDTLEAVAKEIATAESVCILWAMGITQHARGSDASTAIANLLLVTGNCMKPNAGAYPLRGHNNVQGAGDMGAMPNSFPGYQAVNVPENREKFEKAWGVQLSGTVGMNNHEMVEAMFAGKIRALYLAGEDMISADSNANNVAAAFGKLDLFIVQEIFFSETCRYADVILPAAPALEKDGTFTNTERRIQRFYQGLPELGDSKADWKITQLLANEMGTTWNYSHPSEVMAELASLAPLYAGVSYDRLVQYATLQWPVGEDGKGQSLLYTEGFPFPDGKARFWPLEFHEPAEAPDASYDLLLNNGREIEHFHEGNMTNRVPGIHQETPERYLEVSPELAQSREIVTGQWLRVESRWGALKVKALITDRVAGNQVFLPLTSQEGPVNVLTGPNLDAATFTPDYKETPVRIQLLPDKGTNPVTKVSFRYSGKRTPQPGVEIERKWVRDDYHFPDPLGLVQICPTPKHDGKGD